MTISREHQEKLKILEQMLQIAQTKSMTESILRNGQIGNRTFQHVQKLKYTKNGIVKHTHFSDRCFHRDMGGVLLP